MTSQVLVQNPAKVLPLTKGTRIAMIGPHANASMNLIQHDTGKICPGGSWDHNGDAQSQFDCVRSPYG